MAVPARMERVCRPCHQWRAHVLAVPGCGPSGHAPDMLARSTECGVVLAVRCVLKGRGPARAGPCSFPRPELRNCGGFADRVVTENPRRSGPNPELRKCRGAFPDRASPSRCGSGTSRIAARRRLSRRPVIVPTGLPHDDSLLTPRSWWPLQETHVPIDSR